MENIKINRAILHILDSNHQEPILSTKDFELENDISDFLEKHISKVFADAELKNGQFNPSGNEVFNLCSQLNQNEALFIEVTNELTARLFSIMKQNPDIPSGDVIFCIFEVDDVNYFSLIKLNYRHSYIHYVSSTEAGNVNNLIKQKTTLPGVTQKVDECVIINLSNLDLKILEKQYEIDTEKEYYLSKRFLKCQSDLSYLQKVKILDKSVRKITKKHQNEDFDKVSKLRSCLAESIEESNEIRVAEVADAVFGHNAAFKEEYFEEIKKAGLMENNIVVPETSTNKKFTKQKLKTDSGIEINFPSHFYNNPDVMEFINNSDGTISILIKNINKVANK